MTYSYRDTNIWKILISKEQTHPTGITTFLDGIEVMQKIEKVLAKSSTSPNDFTLHDEDHAFRVAQRMFELIPEETKLILSSLEYAFLLLSAYLHDIGMSPENKQITLYKNYLLFNKSEGLSEFDITVFEEFIFKHYGETPFPLKNSVISIDNYGMANEILTYFCRFMHNDWSEKWIIDNLKDKKIDKYPNWSSDLIKVCKSHHYGFDELKKTEFDPILINSQILHFRYLAICLRIADVLEIDPERTPEVILRHRNIADGSFLYWIKDQYINLTFSNNLISIEARPTNAALHKAIEDTAQQIEDELKLCNRLIVEKPLSFHPPHNNLKHTWNIKPVIFKHIVPEKNSYTYIDTSFKVNTKRIIELLAGTQLYNSPLIAIREMLQNSFDAVKECIAYERLESDEPHNEDSLEAIRKRYSITLSLEKIEGEYWLSCKDNGIGMTRDILSGNFLVGGSLKHVRVYQLEKRCHQKGFSTERTGQFGIGVLSYFMIANELQVNTKRRELANDNENNGWSLSIPGLFGFGELKTTKFNPGTEIRLKLKKEIVESEKDFEEKIITEINSFLVYIPCKLRLESKISDVSMVWNFGWTQDETDHLNSLIAQMERSSRYRNNEERLDILIEEHRKRLKWIIREGRFPDGIGFYKIFVPYYELPKGNSFCYLLTDDVTGSLSLVNGKYYMPSFENTIAWNGIKISNREFGRFSEGNPFLCLLNLTSKEIGTINVAREELKIKNEYADIIFNYLETQFYEAISNSSVSFDKAYYALFNLWAIKKIDQDVCVPVLESLQRTVFTKIKNSNIVFPINETGNILISGNRYKSLLKPKSYSFGFSSKSIPNIGDHILLDKMIINKNLSPEEACLFMATVKGFNFSNSKNNENQYIELDFPTELSHICCISYEGKNMLNSSHPLICKLDKSFDLFSLYNNLMTIYDLVDPDSLWVRYADTMNDAYIEWLNKAQRSINDIYNTHPLMNLLFNYCVIMNMNSATLVQENKIIDFDSNWDIYQKEYYSALKRFSDINMHNTLKNFLTEIPGQKLQFLSIDEEFNCSLKTISITGVDEQNDCDTILNILDSVNDDRRFEIAEIEKEEEY